jgi:hypothetical protein
MNTCTTCTYFDEGMKRCTQPALLQNMRMFIPPHPETFVSPYYLSRETALLERLISALGIVRESTPSGGIMVTTLVLPDGSRFPEKDFRPWANVSQAAHLLHLSRTRGIFINYGPVPDRNSDKWEVEDASSGIEREATAHTAPQIIVEMIISRLENEPAEPVPPPAPIINSFTATPDTLPATNDGAVLEWDVLEADTLMIDHIGDVTGAAAWLVTPAQTTTYSLTAVNVTGATLATVTVTVEEAPAPAPTEPEPGTALAQDETEA